MITPLIFSRDRPAQLDLLLRSLEVNGGGLFGRPTVLARWSDSHFYRGYEEVFCDHWFEFVPEYDFAGQVRRIAEREGSDSLFVAFCDDDVLYRDLASFTIRPDRALLLDEDLLCFSLRLGMNTQVSYPLSSRQALPAMTTLADSLRWDWRTGQHDLGYPGSLDGHIFRSGDVLPILRTQSFRNPNTLEEALMRGCALSPRRSMASFFISALVGNPLNRTSETHWSNRVAAIPECAPAEMNKRFLAGERLSLATIDEARVDGAHCEFAPVWEHGEKLQPISWKKIAAGSRP